MKRLKRIFACLLTAALLTAAGLEAFTTGAASAPADSAGLSATEYRTDNDAAPEVFFTSEISPEGLAAVYEALNWTPTGKVAVKVSTGEPPASNYLRPELIGNLVQSVNGTIVECNTAYGGSRASTAMHYQVARDHGFNDIANVRILDENGSMELPVTGGTRLTGDLVGAAFADYDSYLILSHFKGHAMAGYGGAIKNISIGLGSSTGKNRIHTGGKSDARWTGGEQAAFLESMAEAGKAVSDYLGNGERIVYINVMNRLSIDCDCNGHPAEPDIHDIGILASRDPVALDEACVELVRDAEGSASLMNRIGNRNGLHTLEHAEEIGLGSRAYRLTNLDAPNAESSCAIRGLSVSGNAAAVTLTATEGCALMVAGYTQEGRMTDIRAETLSGAAQERTVIVEISSESARYKAFLLDSQSLRPLCESFQA